MNKLESKYFNTALRMDEALLALLERAGDGKLTVSLAAERGAKE